jgi:hypothetical protein
MQADEARRKLAAIVDDVDATVAQHRGEVFATTFGLRRSA